MDDALDDIQFLSASPHRLAVLQALREHDRMTRDEVVAEVDASDRTVKRALNAFRNRGWVLRVNGDYNLTTAGQFVLDAILEAQEHIAVTNEMRPFLSKIEEGDCHAHPMHFDGAEVIQTDKVQPFAAVDHVVGRYSRAEKRADILLSYVTSGVLESLIDNAPNSGVPVCVIVDSHVRAALESNDDYRRLLKQRAADQAIDYREVDDAFPFSAALIDDGVLLNITDKDGLPTVLVNSEHPELVKHIEWRFRAAYERAVPMAFD